MMTRKPSVNLKRVNSSYFVYDTRRITYSQVRLKSSWWLWCQEQSQKYCFLAIVIIIIFFFIIFTSRICIVNFYYLNSCLHTYNSWYLLRNSVNWIKLILLFMLWKESFNSDGHQFFVSALELVSLCLCCGLYWEFLCFLSLFKDGRFS